jgi:hypothetical protein
VWKGALKQLFKKYKNVYFHGRLTELLKDILHPETPLFTLLKPISVSLSIDR